MIGVEIDMKQCVVSETDVGADARRDRDEEIER
jgi:hypothetical protein